MSCLAVLIIPKPSPIPKRGSSTSRGLGIALAPVPSVQSFGWPHPFRAQMVVAMPVPPGLVRDPGAASSPPAVPAIFNLFGGFGSEPATARQLVAPEDTLAAMVAPPATLPPRPKLRAVKLHQATAAQARPLAAVLTPPTKLPPQLPLPTRGWP